MAGVRYFGGNRSSGKNSIASEMIRFELSKQAKLPSADRFKMILKKRLEESRKKATNGRVKVGFKLPGSLKEARQMSKTAEQALKDIAGKKAAKEAKAMRQMVVVTPRVYHNGTLNRKGQIFDVAGNVVGKVNRKNGVMSAGAMGAAFGKYRPKSAMVHMSIQNAITQHSPYFINMRKMQAMQATGSATAWGDDSNVVNVNGGRNNQHYNPAQGMEQYYGADAQGPRQEIGATAWGAASSNVWGTFADNAWGNSMDNVWGGNSSDVWGGIGPSSMWGVKGPHIWGTGSGKNLIKGLSSKVAAFFGLKGGGTAHDGHDSKKNRNRGVGTRSVVIRSGSSGGQSRGPSTVRSAPTTTRR